jgi:hypothetical protein
LQILARHLAPILSRLERGSLSMKGSHARSVGLSRPLI